MIRRRSFAGLVVAAVIALGGCAGISTSALPYSRAGDPGAAFAASPAKGKALVTVVVPKAAANMRIGDARRSPAYVSIAAKGMTVAFKRGGKLVTSDTIALKPGAPGCSPVKTGTSCRLAVPLKACASGNNCYIANVSTYDAVTCKGKPVTCSIPPRAHELSREQKYPVAIFAGQNTKLMLTLAGIPVTTRVVPADAVTRGNGAAFNLIGLGAHALAVQFLDADGEIITGAGAPTLALSAVSGSLSPVTAATPSAASNEIYVTPPSTFNGTATATFTVAASFAGQATNGCTASNANCAPVSIEVNMVQLAAISASSGLQLYALGDASPVGTLAGGLTSVAADAAGNLYTGADVALPPQRSGPESLVAFSPPFTDAMQPTKSLSDGGLTSLVQVPNQTIYAQISSFGLGVGYSYSTQFCANTVCTASAYNLNNAYTSIAADSSGDYALGLKGSNCQVQINTRVVVVSPTFPCAQSMAFDPAGDLFVTLPNDYQVIEASKSSGYATLTTISTGSTVPYGVAVDSNGNLICAGQDALTLAATVQEILATTLAANQGGTISAPDHSIVLGTPASGQGTASEAISIVGETLYAQFSFLNATTGNFATYTLPNLTQAGSTVSNAATLPTGLVVLP